MSYSKCIGFGLILGVAVGFSLGQLWNPSLGSVAAAVGAGLGIVFGAIIGRRKSGSA